jgi:hypothetical protein
MLFLPVYDAGNLNNFVWSAPAEIRIFAAMIVLISLAAIGEYGI